MTFLHDQTASNAFQFSGTPNNIYSDLKTYIKSLDNEMMSRSHLVLRDMYKKHGEKKFAEMVDLHFQNNPSN